ncbi:MAG: hypothetical protein WBE18_01180 [Gammaproteobacteria bacterium]
MFHNKDDYQQICQILGYTFDNQALLQQAVTRKSGWMERKQEKHVGHNET